VKTAVYNEDIVEEFTSADDLEGTTYFKIGNHLVQNVKGSKDSIAIGVKMPQRIVKETMRFTATALNNRIVFIATNAKAKTVHDPAKGDSVCALTPVCTRRWKEGDPIALVLLIGSSWHPKDETEQWVCEHHQEASLYGKNLQIQKLCKMRSAQNKVKKVVDPFKELEVLKEKNEKKSSKDGK